GCSPYSASFCRLGLLGVSGRDLLDLVPISNCNPLAQKQSGHVKNSIIGTSTYFSIAYGNTSRTGEEGGNHFPKQQDRGGNNLWVFWCHILEVNYELGGQSHEQC